MPKSDYDLAVIENERYAPMILGRIDEINDVDYVAVAEQLQSSVDVHVSSVSRPMWDSGSIVSGRGTGERDNTNTNRVSFIYEVRWMGTRCIRLLHHRLTRTRD